MGGEGSWKRVIGKNKTRKERKGGKEKENKKERKIRKKNNVKSIVCIERRLCFGKTINEKNMLKISKNINVFFLLLNIDIVAH